MFATMLLTTLAALARSAGHNHQRHHHRILHHHRHTTPTRSAVLHTPTRTAATKPTHATPRPHDSARAAPPLLSASAAARPPTPSAQKIYTSSATPQHWHAIASALRPFMKDSRIARLEEVLSRRRRGLHLVLENVADPFNAAAVMRSAEGLGVQHVHVVESICDFHMPEAQSRAASAGALGNVAMGASRWLSVTRYRSSVACYEALRERGLRIFASDCPPADDADDEAGLAWQTAKPYEYAAVPVDALDYGAGDVALVFGNERRGVSRHFVERADAAFYLPMCGFTQSFNISVAAAMSLYAAIASGAFPEGSLTDAERVELLGRWLLRDVKAARPILRQAGIEMQDF